MHSRAAWIIIAAASTSVLAAVGGCSDDEDGTSAAQTTTTSTTAASTSSSTSSAGGSGGSATSSSTGMGMGPGTITINVEDATGQEGWLFVASVVDANEMPLARACDTVSAGSASGVASEILPQMDTCQLGEPVVFDEGTYQIKGALYEPDCPAPCAPTLCVATDVTVAGNTTITVPAFSNCVGN